MKIPNLLDWEIVQPELKNRIVGVGLASGDPARISETTRAQES